MDLKRRLGGSLTKRQRSRCRQAVRVKRGRGIYPEQPRPVRHFEILECFLGARRTIRSHLRALFWVKKLDIKLILCYIGDEFK